MIFGEAKLNEELETLMELTEKAAGFLVKYTFPMKCVGHHRCVLDRSNKVYWGEGWQIALSDNVAVQKREGKYYLCREI